MDVWPTVFDILGMESPEYADGKSQLPTILAAGRNEPPPLDAGLGFAHLDQTWGMRDKEPAPTVAVTEGPYRLIHSTHQGAPSRSTQELFDASVDPLELRDLSARDPETTERLKRVAEEYLDDLPEWDDQPDDLEIDEAKEKLIHRYELVTKRARERDSVDIYASFLDSFAAGLDPHSNYLSAEAMEDFQIGMDLSLEGIGVALSSQDGYSVVEKIIPGGAADRIGAFEPQDKIIGVAQEDGELVDIIDMDLRDVVRLIRGKRGTKVHLSVLREKENTERFQITIVRDKINLEEQAASLRFETIEVPTSIDEDGHRAWRSVAGQLPASQETEGSTSDSESESGRLS